MQGNTNNPASRANTANPLTRRQNGGNQRRGGRLSVGPGDRNPHLHSHQFRQHLRSRDHGDQPLFGNVHLGVSSPDGGGDHHHIRLLDVLLPVAIADVAAQGGEPSCHFRLSEV